MVVARPSPPRHVDQPSSSNSPIRSEEEDDTGFGWMFNAVQDGINAALSSELVSKGSSSVEVDVDVSKPCPTPPINSSFASVPVAPHNEIKGKCPEIRLSILDAEKLGFNAPLELFECEISCGKFSARRPGAIFHNLRIPLEHDFSILTITIFRKDKTVSKDGLASRQNSESVDVTNEQAVQQKQHEQAGQACRLLQDALTQSCDLQKPRVLVKLTCPTELPPPHPILQHFLQGIAASGGTNLHMLAQPDSILHQKVMTQLQKYSSMQASRGIFSDEGPQIIALGGNGWYTINGRRVILCSRGANVIVNDSVLHQPLIDYLDNNGQNEEWEPLPDQIDSSTEGQEFWAFMNISKDRRLTFGNDLRGGDGQPPIGRMSAMRVASSMAAARRKAATEPASTRSCIDRVKNVVGRCLEDEKRMLPPHHIPPQARRAPPQQKQERTVPPQHDARARDQHQFQPVAMPPVKNERQLQQVIMSPQPEMQHVPLPPAPEHFFEVPVSSSTPTFGAQAAPQQDFPYPPPQLPMAQMQNVEYHEPPASYSRYPGPPPPPAF